MRRTRLTKGDGSKRRKRLVATDIDLRFEATHKKYLEEVKNFVKLGYQSTSLNFKTNPLKPDDAAEVVKLVPSYNEFRGEKVAKAIKEMRGLVSSVEFGREHSPVLYVQMPYWTNQKAYPTKEDEYPSRKYTEAEMKEMSDKVMSILKKANPDELWVTEYQGIRAWWD